MPQMRPKNLAVHKMRQNGPLFMAAKRLQAKKVLFVHAFVPAFWQG
jgi:hypothetical protein